MPTKIYLNLTNGIEAIEYFPNSTFIRIQSSHCESKAYNRMLMQLSDDFLMNLALGNRVVVIDGSVNPRHPKSLRCGLKVIKAVLRWIWFKEPIVDEFHRGVYKKLDQVTRTKLKYFRKFLQTDKLRLLALSFQTKRNGDYRYYSGMFDRKIVDGI